MGQISATYFERAERAIELLRSLFPIRGIIVSPDLDQAFAHLNSRFPELEIQDYPSGMECEDWIVPPSWHARVGRLEDNNGRILASIDEHFLFVAPYSQSVDGWFSKTEIEAHCRTRLDIPNAYLLEHRNAYDFHLKDWGITLPGAVWQSMAEDGRYRVVIDAVEKPGTMHVGEWLLKGEREDIVCLNAHIDELCNDDLSGCVVGLDVMRELATRPQRRYTYQLLLAPEMIGTIFYVLNNPDRLAKTIAILNLEAVGAGEGWLLKRALRNGERLEEALRQAFLRYDIAHNEGDFFSGYGNDERIFAWPSINVPGIAIQRFPFREYHTSHDTPAILSPRLMAEAIAITEAFVDVLESDYAPNLVHRTQPWLTRHGLYFDATLDRERNRKFNNLVLYNIDGSNTVLDLARISGIEFSILRDYLERFCAKGLLSKREPVPIC